MASLSRSLQRFITNPHPKTIQNLIDSFGEKSFAVLFLLLMITPALPLPTGGVTHIFEIIVMLLALELVLGRKTIWLPKRWLGQSLPVSAKSSTPSRLIKLVQWIEKHSRPRFSNFFHHRNTSRLIGAVVLLFTAFAFLAPPFSGLDTLPALGVVLLALALLFEDASLLLTGLVVGLGGITIIFLIGSLVVRLL